MIAELVELLESTQKTVAPERAMKHAAKIMKRFAEGKKLKRAHLVELRVFERYSRTIEERGPNSGRPQKHLQGIEFEVPPPPKPWAEMMVGKKKASRKRG